MLHENSACHAIGIHYTHADRTRRAHRAWVRNDDGPDSLARFPSNLYASAQVSHALGSRVLEERGVREQDAQSDVILCWPDILDFS